MSATEITLKWTAVVDRPEHMPPWLTALEEETGTTADELVSVMLRAEMAAAGERFMAKNPELFRTGIGLI